MKMLVNTTDVSATVILDKPYMLFASVNSFEHSGRIDAAITAPAASKCALRDMYVNYVNAYVDKFEIPIRVEVRGNGDVAITPHDNVKVNSFEAKAIPVNAQLTDEYNVAINIDYTRFKFELE
jgi:hypothetical protein